MHLPYRHLISLAIASLSACGGPQQQVQVAAGSEPPAQQGGSREPMPLAVASTPSDDFESAPPTVFTPQPHPPHGALRPESVDERHLPALVVRTKSCYGAPPREPWYPGYGRPTPVKGGYSGGAGAGSPPQTKPLPSRAPRGATAPDPLAGASQGRVHTQPARGPTAPRPAAPPMAPPAAEGAGERAEKKADTAAPRRKDHRAQEQADEYRASAPSTPPQELERRAPEPEPMSESERYHDWGAKLYLSNDDSMSLSSAQRVLYAIDHFLPIPAEHVRPHELLNYFSFDTAPIQAGDDFSVHAEIQPKPGTPGAFTLGLSVSGRDVTLEGRRNAALTFVVDRSGSMRDEGRMNYLKQGLRRMTQQLKSGDMVHLVLFDDDVCVPVENFVVGRDPMSSLTTAIDKLEPRGATDVHLGLQKGYALADGAYQSSHNNRVVLITDALTNTGVTDEGMIATVGQHYERRRIRLSGVGVGSDFNDSLLDGLTEAGKGAYVFLGSAAEVDAVFGSRFNSLIETIANDVHFRLHLPPSLGLDVFYGEESSTLKEDVQAIHYFAGTSQMFLSDVSARGGRLRTQDGVMLSVEYENAETGAAQVEEFAFNLGQIAQTTRNVQKARLIMSFIDGLRDTLGSAPERREHRSRGWRDPYAAEQCARGKRSLAEQAEPLGNDPEVRRVLSVWDRYCERYEPLEVPRQPMRREPPRGADVWPSAQR